MQEWVSIGTDKERRKWCKENYIHQKAMCAIQSTARDTLALFKYHFRAEIIPAFGVHSDRQRALLRRLVNRCFQQTLAVYTGHPRIGYVSLSDGAVTRVHPGSSLMHTEGAMPKYIVYNQVVWIMP